MIQRMRNLAGLVLMLLMSLGLTTPSLAESVAITGAGATFPYPLYSRWAFDYAKESGVKLNYQSIGSGGGIAQIKAKTVDFGASDAPLDAKELETLGLVQFPMTIGGVVPILNLQGIEKGQLKLTGEVLADIYLGKITRWDDPAIVKLNPDMKLPGDDIAVVYRADGSGTTWIFTNYLSKVSPQWKERVGNDKAVKWPTGMGGKGNEGVSAYVQKIKGSIGYVEYAYALENKLNYAQLRNQDGLFVSPTAETFQAAAASATWGKTPGMGVVLTAQGGAKSWPITGASFILMHAQQANGEHAREVLRFFDWCYRKGEKSSLELNYVPLPADVVAMVEAKWAEQLRAEGQPIWQAKPAPASQAAKGG